MKVVEVVAGLITDARGRVLLARRTEGRDLAGLWEFPGGKRELGETPEAALARELHEELGIDVRIGGHLITVPQAYPGKRLRLDVRRIERWTGIPRGREGQALAWVPPHKLDSYDMPPADIPVVAALRQPELYAVSPGLAAGSGGADRGTGHQASCGMDNETSCGIGNEASCGMGNEASCGMGNEASCGMGNEASCGMGNEAHCGSGYSRDPGLAAIAAIAAPTIAAAAAAWLAALDATLAAGITRIQLRLPGVAPDVQRQLAAAAAGRCRDAGAELLLNADIALARELGAGVHLRAAQLAGLRERPELAAGARLAASCHTAEDLAHAARLGCDFAVLGAVKPTASHPGQPGIGWDAFARLRECASLPIYAIGGLGPADMEEARRHGAQGIAAIRSLWSPA